MLRSPKETISVDTNELGIIQLRSMAVGDRRQFTSLNDPSVSDRRFCALLANNQIISPALTNEDVESVSDSLLKRLLRELIALDPTMYAECELSDVSFAAVRNSHKRAIHERVMKLASKGSPSFAYATKKISRIQKELGNNYLRFVLSISGFSEFLKLGSILPRLVATGQTKLASSAMDTLDRLAEISHVLENWTATQDDRFTEYLWRREAEVHAIAPWLQKYKWFISPSIPTELDSKIVNALTSNRNVNSTLNSVFVDYFKENNWEHLKEMIESWKDCELYDTMFKKRMKIIRDCVEIIRSKELKTVNSASIVIPVLIAQIDGIIYDYLILTGTPAERTKKRNSGIKNALDGLIGEPYDEMITQFFDSNLFQKSTPGKPLENPFILNRHKIMHGESTNYGRKDHVVRVFMFIDCLTLLGFEKEDSMKELN